MEFLKITLLKDDTRQCVQRFSRLARRGKRASRGLPEASWRGDPTARVAPTAVLCGDVTVGPNTSIGFGAVLTAESGPIAIGANCIVMDTEVLRGIANAPLTVGDNVLIGPRAYLSGCTIEDDVFIATGVTVFNGVRIGRGAEVRINGIVHVKTVLPAGATVPLGWIAVGSPAEILPPPPATTASGLSRSR